MKTAIRSIMDTNQVPDDEIGSGLNQIRYIMGPFYRVVPGVKLIMEYEHERDFGNLKNIRRQHHDSTIENTLTIGFSFLI